MTGAVGVCPGSTGTTARHAAGRTTSGTCPLSATALTVRRGHAITPAGAASWGSGLRRSTGTAAGGTLPAASGTALRHGAAPLPIAVVCHATGHPPGGGPTSDLTPATRPASDLTAATPATALAATSRASSTLTASTRGSELHARRR
jgi:hypothetical protein